MYRILKKRKLAEKIFLMEVQADRVAKKCLPGEFLIVRIDQAGERIPLTICDYDAQAGTVTIVFQPIGYSTKKMLELKEGDAFEDFVGPLGRPSEFCTMDPEELKKKKIVFVGGGVGTAPVYPQLKWLHEHGVTADAIIGARTKDLIILEDKMKAVSNLYLTTDDGSYVRKGMGTDVLRDLVQNQCRLIVGGEVKFACVDGPEFDGHLVDFDLAMKRQQMYKTEEGRALLKEQEGATHHGGCGSCGGDK